MTDQPPEVSLEENIAAYVFRASLIPRADDPKNLLWHGWALFDAFIAGIRWQQQRAKADEQRQGDC